MEFIRSERITPYMHRVVPGVLRSPNSLRTGAHTDKYVKVTFVHPDVAYDEPLDVDQLRSSSRRSSGRWCAPTPSEPSTSTLAS